MNPPINLATTEAIAQSLSSDEHHHQTLLSLIESQKQLRQEINFQKERLQQLSHDVTCLLKYFTGGNEALLQEAGFAPIICLPAVEFHSLHELFVFLQRPLGEDEAERITSIIHRHFVNDGGLPAGHALMFGSLQFNTFVDFLPSLMVWTQLLNSELTQCIHQSAPAKGQDASILGFLRSTLMIEDDFQCILHAICRVFGFWECVVCSPFLQPSLPSLRADLRLALREMERVYADFISLDDRDSPPQHTEKTRQLLVSCMPTISTVIISLSGVLHS